MCITTNSRMPEWLRRALMVALIAVSACAAQAGATWTLPDIVPSEASDWRIRGEGELRWFGFRVYDAALWVRGDGAWRPERAFALELRYGRAIPSARLIETSLAEMRRLQVADEATLERWRPRLEAAFPSVEPGDVIVGLRDADGSVAFYHRGALTVRIAEAGFADAFFAIWLDARTREPALRARLLGEATDG